MDTYKSFIFFLNTKNTKLLSFYHNSDGKNTLEILGIILQ